MANRGDDIKKLKGDGGLDIFDAKPQRFDREDAR